MDEFFPSDYRMTRGMSTSEVLKYYQMEGISAKEMRQKRYETFVQMDEILVSFEYRLPDKNQRAQAQRFRAAKLWELAYDATLDFIMLASEEKEMRSNAMTHSSQTP